MKISLLIAAATFLTALQTQAVPYTYTYTGDFFTGNQFQTAEGLVSVDPIPAGFTLQDRAIISFTVDDSTWGAGEFGGFGGTFRIGPYDGIDTARIVIDSTGTIVQWSIWGLLASLDWASGGIADGSGQDIIFGSRWSQGTIHGGAFVNYPAGSPSRWTFASVPDAASTLLLFSLSLIPILGFLPQSPQTQGMIDTINRIVRPLARIFHTPCDEIGGSAVEIVIELALMP
jgi:hypothetical protein